MTKRNNIVSEKMETSYWSKVSDKKSVVGTYEIDPWVLDALEKKGRPPNTKNTECAAGHKFVEGSYRDYVNAVGYTERRCLICKAEKAKAYKSSLSRHTRDRINERESQLARERRAAKRLGIPVEDYRATLGNTDIKKNPLAYLITTPEEGKAQDAVNYAVDDRGRPKCEPHPEDYFSDTEMSNEDAKRLCGGCPLVVECLARMKSAAPIGSWMVAGQRVFYDGKMIALSSK